MSLVFALRDRTTGLGYLAADSGAESTVFPEVEVFSTPKQVKLTDTMAVGGVGSYRILQALQEAYEAVPCSVLLTTRTGLPYWKQELLPAFRERLNDAGQSAVFENEGAELLAIVDGHIIEIDHTYHVLEHARDFAATGSGAPYAKAAWLTLRALQPENLTVEQQLELVFVIVAELTYTVKHPVTISTVQLHD